MKTIEQKKNSKEETKGINKRTHYYGKKTQNEKHLVAFQMKCLR